MEQAGAVSASGLELQAGGSQQPKAGPDDAVLMSFNVEWLSENAPQQRMEKLRRIVKDSGAQIIGFQEIKSRRALTRWMEPGWNIVMLDSGEDQELALAVRAPFRISSWQMAFPGRSNDSFFPRQRDALRAVVQTPDGGSLVVYVVHLKSRGPEGRLSTDPRRIGAARLLAKDAARQRHPVVVMGDFNDTPGDESLQELAKAPLVNLAADFYKSDGVTVDLDTMDWRSLREPIVPGARNENERWRGKEYDFRSDVRIKPALFDQILVSPSISNAGTWTFRAMPPRMVLDGSATRMNQGRITEEGTRASDHLPVVATVRLP